MPQYDLSNILFFPDMKKDYSKQLDDLLKDIIDKAIDGKTLAEINSLLVLSNKQAGVSVNSGYAAILTKGRFNFKLEVTRGK